MRGNSHVRFLGEGWPAMAAPYPTCRPDPEQVSVSEAWPDLPLKTPRWFTLVRGFSFFCHELAQWLC